MNDLRLGVRIALGGGRASWRRLALTGTGVGLGVAVLLLGASAPTALTERQARQDASRVEQQQSPLPGVDPLYRRYQLEFFRSDQIMGSRVVSGGPRAPIPPGLPRIPDDGEIFVSPALADLLASPEGELLRPRFPQKVVGLIAKDGLIGPNHLLYIAGDARVERLDRTAYYSFGRPSYFSASGSGSWYWALWLVAAIVLLMPVLVFVTIGTRLAGPERDRRLAALRLIGASSRQVRRIATGDALAGAVVGVVLGAVFFAVSRPLVERVELFGLGVFASDLVPNPLLAVLVVLAVPVLAVAAAMVTMRGSVVDPLGVVSQGKPVRRRLWWRFAPVLIGAALLASQAESFLRHPLWVDGGLALAGIALLLLGIPLLLPWIVERAVGSLRGGPPSWQLAVRRLQVDSGSAARVVGGIAVVLAGGIALQTAVIGNEAELVAQQQLPNPDQSQSPSKILVLLSSGASEHSEEFAERLRTTEGVTSVLPGKSFPVRRAGGTENYYVFVGSCANLRNYVTFDQCQDGDSFQTPGPAGAEGRPRSGEEVSLLSDEDPQTAIGTWTVPQLVDVSSANNESDVNGVFVTPGALGGKDVSYSNGRLLVSIDVAAPDVVEKVRNAAAALGPGVAAVPRGWMDSTGDRAEYRDARQVFFLGTVIVLLLAAANLLVLALEQVRVRRRPLAVLSAGGVPRSTLAWSLLWQNAVPLVLAVVVAVVIGTGTGLLFQRAMVVPLTVDLAGIGVLVAAVVVTVLLVTACTLPAVRRATGATGLRAE
ncbi:MAG: FtsX-like permease family protein [Umezawaea sp.]